MKKIEKTMILAPGRVVRNLENVDFVRANHNYRDAIQFC